MDFELTSYAGPVFRALFLSAFTFVLAMVVMPKFINFIYRHKLWRKKEKDRGIDGRKLEVVSKFHSGKATSVPRVGGLIVWIIPLAVILFVFLWDAVAPTKWNFLNDSWVGLPLVVLIAASLVGLFDDLLQIRGTGRYVGGGLKLSWRISLMSLIGLAVGGWIYFKLGLSSIAVPGLGSIMVGWWIIPISMIIMVATYSGGVIDGLDGLAGGTFAIIFTALSVIAFFGLQYDLAAFSLVLVGSILAFLWFNIPPAVFYLGETGTMGLGATLAVLVLLTNSIFVLPIIGFLLVWESSSVIAQLLAKKFLGRKILLSAPIHHHFEGKGWPSHRVTMRFWMIGFIAAIIGVAIRILL